MNTAVIGCGFMGSNHARIYSEISNLVSVCDMDKDAVQAITKKYKCHSYSDYLEMVQCEEHIDAISVVVPTKAHFKVVTDLIPFGIPILVEKPIASTVKEAKQIVAFAKKNNLKIMVGHIERFNPVISAAKNIIDKGMIGEILSFRGVRVGPFTPRVKDAGVLHIFATHDLDLFTYLANSEMDDIKCVAVQNKLSEFEDVASIICKLKNGAVGSLEVNWTSPKKIRTLTVTGTKGILELDYLTQRLVLTEADGGERSVKNYSDFLLYNVVGEQRQIEVIPNEPLKLELEHFLKCVEDKKPFLVNEVDGLKVLESIEKCKEGLHE